MDVLKEDMIIGALSGAEAAVADFYTDTYASTNWILFGNGRTSSSNGRDSLGIVFDFPEDWPSLEPPMVVIDKYQDKSPTKTPQRGWNQGHFSVKSPGVTNTHSKHHDRENKTETFLRETFGTEKNRVRIEGSKVAPHV